MPRVLRITVLTGPHRHEHFSIRERADCIIGRSGVCSVRLAGTERDQYISRLHCRLVLDAASVTLQDLGSRSGTYLGATKVDFAVLPLAGCATGDGCANAADGFDQGCLLNVGGTTLRLNVVDCPPDDTSYADRDGDSGALWQGDETAKHSCHLHYR